MKIDKGIPKSSPGITMSFSFGMDTYFEDVGKIVDELNEKIKIEEGKL